MLFHTNSPTYSLKKKKYTCIFTVLMYRVHKKNTSSENTRAVNLVVFTTEYWSIRPVIMSCTEWLLQMNVNNNNFNKNLWRYKDAVVSASISSVSHGVYRSDYFFICHKI